MLRQLYVNKSAQKKDKVRWRGHEILRIEAFSDGVFAFIISLLIVSLEVPKTSKELLETMIGFLPFSICFGVVLTLWHNQYKFFRRFGLHDSRTIAINSAFIFMTLIYVFPLKFILSNVFLSKKYILFQEDTAILFMFYNGGIAVLYILFAWMYHHAYRKREELALTKEEAFETIFFMLYYAIPAFVAFVATLIVFLNRNNDINHITTCFIAYASLSIFMPLIGKIRDREFRKRFGDEKMIEPQLGAE